ncbi:hypothetical protein EDB86DRAFT_746831 [Lactarius hatsudake]|nr:hypothetical protein EDB86DRAFT_746831 [Lactarius hatsudake]
MRFRSQEGQIDSQLTVAQVRLAYDRQRDHPINDADAGALMYCTGSFSNKRAVSCAQSQVQYVVRAHYVTDKGKAYSVTQYVLRHAAICNPTTHQGMFARCSTSVLARAYSPLCFIITLGKMITTGLTEPRVLLVKGDEKSGFATCAPYDVIHVTEVVEEIPPQLLTQLATPGHMIILVRTDGCEAMIQVDKDAAGDVSQKDKKNCPTHCEDLVIPLYLTLCVCTSKEHPHLDDSKYSTVV